MAGCRDGFGEKRLRGGFLRDVETVSPDAKVLSWLLFVFGQAGTRTMRHIALLRRCWISSRSGLIYRGVASRAVFEVCRLGAAVVLLQCRTFLDNHVSFSLC